ncbi:MAG: acyl-CoA thioesterase [Myxococcales bacterium]|nr:acyl-CoA thioesterase [Myxococcales bacterium]
MSDPSNNPARPVCIELPVMWGDMDALGHVNNAVYARWLEQARIAYFERLGLIGGGSVGPILARQAIDFREPVTYPDTVSVSVGVTRIGTTSLTLGYRTTSQAKQGMTVMEAESVIVVFDYATGKKTPVSAELKRGIDSLQKE